MRTLAFIIGGFFVFFLLLLTTQRSDKRALARVSANFIGLWFVVAAGNLYYGVAYADYSPLGRAADRGADLPAARHPGGRHLVPEPRSVTVDRQSVTTGRRSDNWPTERSMVLSWFETGSLHSRPGHEFQRQAPACWAATLHTRWGAPGDDQADHRPR